jgi:hypothetical protein
VVDYRLTVNPSGIADEVPRRSGHPPVRSFGGLLKHLASLTRNQISIAGNASADVVAVPTPDQRKAFEPNYFPRKNSRPHCFVR